MAESVSPVSSKSRARRLRSASTRRQLYQRSQENGFDKRKVDRLIDTVDNLVIMLQSCAIHSLYPAFHTGDDSNCWDPCFSFPGDSSCNPQHTETTPEECHASFGSHDEDYPDEFGLTVDMPTDDVEIASGLSEHVANLQCPDAAEREDDMCPVPCCKCRQSLQDCGCQWELSKGATVILCGLQKASELNGQVARVEQWNSEDGRWSVRLKNGGGKRVRPEHLRANPREIAAETFADIEKSLKKFESLLAQLNSNALDAEANLESLTEQKRVLDEMPNCPADMLSKVRDLIAQAQSNAKHIHGHIEAVKEEREAALANGMAFVVQLVSKFMQHAGG